MSDKTYGDYMREQEEADRAEALRAVINNPPKPSGPARSEVLGPTAQTSNAWPKPLEPEAFHGPAGEVVKLVLPPHRGRRGRHLDPALARFRQRSR